MAAGGAAGDEEQADTSVVVIGAGPAGLTAARELTRLGHRPLVLEKSVRVGGLACTVRFKGFHFDMGGHRFFTKIDAVNKLWHEVLGPDLLRRPRQSRIFYQGRFFHYPLRPLNALLGLGIWQAVLIVASYVRWHLRPHPREDTFEQWVTNRFGQRLFAIFFKTYTEKVWGISCSELRAEWAVQRIRGLSLRRVLLAMFVRPKDTIKTLIEEFDYPRLGPGMMWEAVATEVRDRGGDVRLESDVVRISRAGPRITGVTVARDGRQEVVRGTHVVSSMPISELVLKLSPPPPPDVVQAARQLSYRDFLTVCLVVDRPGLFPDNWIYVHSPEVKVGRIQNFGNWSPDMVPDPTKTSLGLEYFCREGDALWSTPDAELVQLARDELQALGLASGAEVVDGCVFRVPKAYPVYDATYAGYMATLRGFVDGLENFQTIGRNGLHRYNNQDHSMLTGLLAARNVVLGERHDLWSVHTEAEYDEEIGEEGLERVLTRSFPRLDRVALGASTGAVTGLLLALATATLLLRGHGDAAAGQFLELLAAFFPGYSVTLQGCLLGFVYGAAVGGIAGWTFAVLRNAALFLYVATVRRRSEARLLRRFFEFV